MSRLRIECSTVVILIATAVMAWGDSLPAGEIPKRFQTLPTGWTVTKSITLPMRNLGGSTVALSNTVLSYGGQALQINLVDCRSDEEAAKVHELLLRAQQNQAVRCPRDGQSLAEFVTKDPRLIERAYEDFGFKPPRITYDVSFRAAPFERCDYMQWNKMFNACLPSARDEALIRDLAKSFTFGERIQVRTHGLGKAKSTFQFTPPPSESQAEAEGDVTCYSFAGLNRDKKMPEVGVTLQVISEAFSITPTQRKAGRELMQSTEYWPSDDAEIIALSKRITAGKNTVREKTAALLDWLRPGPNIKYGGPILGSRFGVKKTLQQGFGRCWDFSDCFVALSRAAGVPSRQVLGWLHGTSGHVWAEVLEEGAGWRQVDPTAGMGCDCNYIPYVATETGSISFVYVSNIDIKVRR